MARSFTDVHFSRCSRRNLFNQQETRSMKLLFGILILGAAASVFGQDAAAPAAGPVRALMPMPATDVILAGVKKNVPFTADESGETVRIMPDGNRVVQN